MTLSLHIVVDNAPNDRLDRAIRYLKNVRPSYVNIGAGAQLERGMHFVDRVKAEIPEIEVIWRNLTIEDTGIYAQMSAGDVYRKKVLPFVDWFKRHELIFMPANESSGDDEQMKRYVAWQVEMAVLLHSNNLRGAFCRFATGNINDGTQYPNQYPLLKPIFNAMLPGDIISPNEYSGQPGVSSAGHIERYKLMWRVAGKPLPTVIGEAGIAVNYDPGKGYQSIGLSGVKYGQQMLGEELWYENGKIDRCLYILGGYSHESYRLGDDVLDYLESHYVEYRKNNPVPLPTPPPPVEPVPPIVPPITPTPAPPPPVVVPVPPVPPVVEPQDTALARIIRALDSIREHEAAIAALEAEIEMISDLHRPALKSA